MHHPHRTSPRVRSGDVASSLSLLASERCGQARQGVQVQAGSVPSCRVQQPGAQGVCAGRGAHVRGQDGGGRVRHRDGFEVTTTNPLCIKQSRGSPCSRVWNPLARCAEVRASASQDASSACRCCHRAPTQREPSVCVMSAEDLEEISPSPVVALGCGLACHTMGSGVQRNM